MSSQAYHHHHVIAERMRVLLLFALLVSTSPLATAFHGGDDDREPQHLDIYSAEEDEVQLFDNVVYLTEKESEEFFSFVIGKNETSLEDFQLTLYLERVPSSLKELRKDDILVAAVTPPESLYHFPWDDTPWFESVNERLAWDGLLHRVIAVEETDDGWRFQLEQATLADAIERGTIIIKASRMIRSIQEGEEEMFGLDPYISQEGDHYRKIRLHTTDMHCTPGRFQVDTVENVEFQDGIEADIAYSAVLHMIYEFSFDSGQIENAKLGAKICQAGSLALRAAHRVDKEWLLWKDKSRPQVFRVGLLPIVARAGGSLTYGLNTSAELEQQDPIFLKHHLQRQANRSQGIWSLSGPELASPTIHIPDPSLYIDVEATSKLVPQLEVILYGLAGPYIQASGATTLGWHSAPSEASLRAGLTLQAGIQQARPVVSLCQQGECEKTLASCEWDWDFDQLAFGTPRCE